MPATASKYRSPFVSEVLRETDGSIDDCATSSGLMLACDWTLGEFLIRPDGSTWNVLQLREVLRKKLGPDDKVGGLTLHDVSDALRAIDPELPPLPRYSGQALEPGQSPDGATLRLAFEEWQAKIREGHVGLLCGIPAGVADPKSPLRALTRFDGFSHVIWVGDGDKDDALAKDPMHARRPGYKGERVSWRDLRQYTEAKKGGSRAFGSSSAIACALVPVGGETEAARVARKSLATIARLNDKVAGQRAQTQLATEERDAARAEAKLAHQAADGLLKQRDAALARVKELEALPAPDCALQVKAERVRVLDLLSGRFDEIVAEIR